MNTPTAKPRIAGILCPVFALRASQDFGIGDTAATIELIDWAAETGVRFVQLLPINATGGDNSPYNAISSIALEPLTLDLRPGKVPGITEADLERVLTQHRVEELREGPVQYDRVREMKLALIKTAFDAFSSPTTGASDARRGVFESFCEKEASWLDDFCLFRVLMDENGHEDWTSWRADCNTADRARDWLSANEQAVRPRIAFHAFAQWLCHEQWTAVRDHARSRGVKLMGDVPFGISFCSADVFFQQGQFNLDWCGGAPPESYFKDDHFVQKWGQNWGIPLYRWDVMEAGGFSWWTQRVKKLCEVFDLFRIDHVLGFYRIYSFPWRPQRNPEFLALSAEEARARTGGHLPHYVEYDDDSTEGRAANLAHGDKYLRMIVKAAGNSEVVAEDLGTVPPYVRPHLLWLDIPGFKICHWEDNRDGHVTMGSDYPNCAFTTYATHDHQPMKTHWEQRRREAGSDDEPTRYLANLELRFLSEFAGLWEKEGNWSPYNEGIRRALLEALLASNARFAAFMITDLFGMEDRFNVPGIAGAMNWSARLPMTIQQMKSESPYREECEWLKSAIEKTGR